VAGSLAEAVGYFKSSQTDDGDNFGDEVALSADGNTLAVAASLEGDSPGAIYVFHRDDANVWTQQARLTPAVVGVNLYFGSPTLSADGNTLVARENGSIYVFERDAANVWTQREMIDSPYCGPDMALSADGNILVCGAADYGVIVMQRAGAEWLPDILSVGTPLFDVQLSADGTIVAAVAPWQDSGTVYVFERDDIDGWAQQAQIQSSHDDGEYFGEGLALSADGATLAVSSRLGPEPEFVVEVFERDGDAWTGAAELARSWNWGFGSQMALAADGSVLAVGSPDDRSGAIGVGDLQTDNFEPGLGAVHVFRREQASVWTLAAFVKASNNGVGLEFGLPLGFGSSVALSADGSTLAVGAPGETSAAVGIGGDQTDSSFIEAGAVYLY
jgi:hypothetical protein